MSTAYAARPAWRPTPGTLAQQLVGLWLFGTGEGLLVHSALGNSPWTVLAQGVAVQTPLSVGAATIVISFFVLLLWIPLRQWPGLGTLLNAVLIGVALDVTLSLLGGRGGTVIRVLEIPAAIALVALGSGLYITTGLGPGPRDGLMIGLHRRTGRSVALIRMGIELTAFTVGAILGGTFGVGTLSFALLIGPTVAFSLRRLLRAPSPIT